MRTRHACLLTALLLLAGCISAGPTEVQDAIYYKVSIDPPLPAGGGGHRSLLLRPFTAYESLDREGVRYLTSDVEGGYWNTHLWSEPVAAMVGQETGRYLEATGLFREVLLLDNAAAAEFVLDGQARRFEEVDREDGWSGVVEISFELTRMGDGEVLFHRTYRDEEPCRERTVREVARALGRALERVLARLTTELSTYAKEGR